LHADVVHDHDKSSVRAREALSLGRGHDALVVCLVMSPVYACLGHWYVQIAFAGPSLLVFGVMARDSIRRRWRAFRGLEPIVARPRQKTKAAPAQTKRA
jgi:hypothetical protein